MMKNLLILILTTVTLNAAAQVLNPSFEDWTTKQNQIQVTGTANFQGFDVTYSIDDPQFTYNEIVDWSSLNQLTPTRSLVDLSTNDTLVELVTVSTDFVDGSQSVRLESKEVEITAQVFGTPFSIENVAPGLIVSGDFVLDVPSFATDLIEGNDLSSLNPFALNGTGQAIDFRPAKLYGSYQYAGVNGDSAVVVSGIIKNREIIAFTSQRLPNASVWTTFELDFNYLNCTMPDTIVTLIMSSNLSANFDEFGVFSVANNYTGENGSVLLIDDLTMDTVDLSVFPPIAINDSSVILDIELATMIVTNNDDFCGGVVPLPTIVTNGTNGNATIDALGELEYIPNMGFSGIDEVVYSVCKSPSSCDTAIWYITVSLVPSCIAVDDNRSLNENSSSTFDPLANDNDCGGNPTILTLALNGVANVESNGFVSYSPVNDFVGMDSLKYYICSTVNTSQCDTATIFYEVLEVVGIQELPLSSITLAPNPAKDIVQINIDNAKNISTKITVFNLLGKVVETVSFETQIVLNLEDYSTGIYLIQLENRNGKATRKLIVSK